VGSTRGGRDCGLHGTARRGGPGSARRRPAEPSWADPLDTSYSRQRGGRWNAPGSFGVLYLNRNLQVARLQVRHKLRGHPYGVEDLDEAEQHDLVSVQVAERDWLDCVTVPDLEAVGLPATYPRHRNGRPVRHVDCQPIGGAAFDDGRPGIACRSAASPTDEELAVFDRDAKANVRMTGKQPFADWFWGVSS
jgi:RES domain-containing protein